MWQELWRILGDSGTELAHEELLDAVWLAERLPPGAAAALTAAGAPDEAPGAGQSGPEAPSADQPPVGPVRAASGPGGAGGTGDPLQPGAGPGATGVHGAPATRSSGPAASRPATPVRVPEARALASAELRLGRALRPLKQLRPDRTARELDEPATVTAIADTGVPDVVLRPARTRWLDLALLVDDGVSMLLWQRLATEARRLMERIGAFRDVRVYALDTRGPEAPVLGHRPFAREPRPLSLNSIADPGGRTLLLVLSDGVGPAWRDGRMHRALERAAGLGPVAVVHALPERLWDGSGIRAEPWRVTTSRRGAANRTWRVTDPVLPPDIAPYTGVPVPVLAPDPESVGAWAQLVGSSGTSAVLPLLAPRTPPRRYAATRTNDGDGLLRFRDAATPQAYRLAAHLAAVAPVSVPAMRLVQDALGPETDTGHLAEVFLGGLMHGAEGPEPDLLPQHRGFDFAEDARRILLHTVPPPELVRTTRAVTARMAELADGTAGFPAWLPHPAGRDEVAAGAEPFGWVDDRLLRRLGMPGPSTSAPAAVTGTCEPSAAPGSSAPEAPDLTPSPEPTGTAGPTGPSDPSRAPLGDGPPSFVDRPGSNWVSLRPSEGLRSAGPYRLVARRLGGWPRVGVFLGTADDHASYVMLRVPERVDRATADDLLTTEAEALARLGAGHVPRLLGVSTLGPVGWLATEWLTDPATREPAPTLRTYRSRYGTLAPERFLAIGAQFAAAMAAAHREGLVHGTLLPSSVLVAGDDVRVTGWMTATVDGVHSRHREGFRQRREYEAPEIFDSDEPSPAADVFAMGTILAQAVTGAWASPNRLPSLAEAPDEIAAVLAGCRAEDPAARPSAEELLWAFDPRTRPALTAPGPVHLGDDDEGVPVSLDMNGPEHGGMGPHGLLHGGTGSGRRALLSGLVQQLAGADDPGACTVVCADHDGALSRSSLASLPHVLWCEAVGGRPEVLRELTELLAEERRRRGTESLARGLPRLLVVLGDLDRTAGSEEPFFALAEEVTALSRCSGVHVLVSQHTARSPLVDLLAPSYTIELTPLRARLRHGGAAPVDFGPGPVPTPPARSRDHDARHAYGITLLRDGRPELALRVLGEVVTTREETLGAGHEATLASRYERASALLALGRSAEALAEYRQVAQARSRVLGADHPDTLDARQQTAQALGLLGRHSEALTQYLEVLARRERLQGTAHEDTLRCRHDVASTLSAMGRLAEASKVALETHRARSEVLGELHAETLATLHVLAHTAARSARWDEAAELFETVVAGRTRTLGRDHADTVAAARSAAAARQRSGSGDRPPRPPKEGTQRDLA